MSGVEGWRSQAAVLLSELQGLGHAPAERVSAILEAAVKADRRRVRCLVNALTPAEQSAAATILAGCRDGKVLQVTRQAFARKAGVSDKLVASCIGKLQAAALIAERAGGANGMQVRCMDPAMAEQVLRLLKRRPELTPYADVQTDA